MAIKEQEFEGFTLLYGTSARENDRLSTEVAGPHDFWFHAADFAGSHVVVRNPDRLATLPKTVERHAAEIAVFHSKAKGAKGKVEVHLAFARDVKKPPSFPPGKVLLKSYKVVKVYSPSNDKA